MNQAELFAIILRRNQKSLAAAVDGVTHAESVLQLPGNSNCMNWIVGHICIYRDGMLVCTRQAEQMNTAEVDRYVFGTDPITSDSESVDFERLVDLQAQTFNSLIACKIKKCPFLFSRRASVNKTGFPFIFIKSVESKERKSVAPG